MKTIQSFFNRFGKTSKHLWKSTRHRKGQTLVEYAMIISLIIVVCMAVVLSFSSSLRGMFSTITSQVNRVYTGS